MSFIALDAKSMSAFMVNVCPPTVNDVVSAGATATGAFLFPGLDLRKPCLKFFSRPVLGFIFFAFVLLTFAEVVLLAISM